MTSSVTPGITPEKPSSFPNSPIFTTNAPPPKTDTFLQAPLTIDKTYEGKVIHVNLVKYIGSVSSPETRVTVNNLQASVNDEGSYFVYLDLVPGMNTIDVKTISPQSNTSDKISLAFMPPLAILLDWPGSENINDYRKSPVTITGSVSDPLAKVKINNLEVVVDSNSTFSAQIQLKEGDNLINAIAVRDNETDTDGIKLTVTNNGLLTNPPPGFRSQYRSRLISNNTAVDIDVGGATSAEFTLQRGKYNCITASNYNIALSRVSKLYAQDELPLLPELTVNINPSKFILYPKIEYHSLIEINASINLVASNYIFRVYQTSTNSGVLGSEFYFSVKVNRP
jgi:hypothetical protein